METITNFFDENLVLENELVRLEPLTTAHFDVLLQIALQQQNLWKFTTAKIRTVADFTTYFNTALQERVDKKSYPFAYFNKQTNEYVGCTRYGNIDFKNKKLEIGWTWLSNPLHGTGFNRNCKFLLLNYGFEVLDLNRIELKTGSLNVISQKAIQNIGAVKEGVFRNHIITDDGSIRHSMYFSFIKEEWPATKQKYFEGLY